MDGILTILEGDACERLRELPDECVHCCVTSPPYWGLRDYGTAEWEGGGSTCDHKYSVSSPYNENFNERWGNASGAKKQESERHEVSYKSDCGKCGARRIDSQIGLEKTPEEYVGKMVGVFREVRRVLRRDGTLWLNLGDSYAGSPAGNTGERRIGNGGQIWENKPFDSSKGTGLKPKDLCGIPWRVAFALQADGWWLRSDIIWAKPNPMPESVTDRPTKSHEYLFLLTKSASYFYDAEAIKEQGEGRLDRWPQSSGRLGAGGLQYRNGAPDLIEPNGRNKRSVWTVATAPYPEAHFATYPPDLIKPCIMAGTSARGCCAECGAPWERVVERESLKRNELPKDHEHYRPAFYVNGKAGDPQSPGPGQAIVNTKTLGWQPTCECDAAVVPCTVLDPFAGSGTTGAVALELGRKAILIELNPKYIELIRQRCDVTLGLALA